MENDEISPEQKARAIRELIEQRDIKALINMEGGKCRNGWGDNSTSFGKLGVRDGLLFYTLLHPYPPLLYLVRSCCL